MCSFLRIWRCGDEDEEKVMVVRSGLERTGVTNLKCLDGR